MKTTIHQDTHFIVSALADIAPLGIQSDSTLDLISEVSGISVDDIVDFKYQAAVSGTNERVDFTVAAPTSGAEYKVSLLIKRALGEEIQRLSASVIAANAVAADVAQQLVDALNALQGTPVTAVRSTADVQITLATAAGEVAGEGDIVETKVAKDGAASFTASVGSARVIPYGQGTQVKRLDDAAGINFHGTAAAASSYNEATFFLKTDSGTERKKVTAWVKTGITGVAYIVAALQAMGGASAGKTGGNTSGLTNGKLVIANTNGGTSRDEFIPAGTAAATCASGGAIAILLDDGAPVGTVTRVTNSTAHAMALTRVGSEKIDGANTKTINNTTLTFMKASSTDWVTI